MEEKTFRIYKETLKVRGSFYFSVIGYSMFPFLLPLRKVKIGWKPFSHLRIGEIIAYKNGRGSLVIHRIIFKKKGEAITKGDFAFSCDPPVRERSYLGVVKDIEGRGRWCFRIINDILYPFPYLYSIFFLLLSPVIRPFLVLWGKLKSR